MGHARPPRVAWCDWCVALPRPRDRSTWVDRRRTSNGQSITARCRAPADGPRTARLGAGTLTGATDRSDRRAGRRTHEPDADVPWSAPRWRLARSVVRRSLTLPPGRPRVPPAPSRDAARDGRGRCRGARRRSAASSPAAAPARPVGAGDQERSTVDELRIVSAGPVGLRRRRPGTRSCSSLRPAARSPARTASRPTPPPPSVARAHLEDVAPLSGSTPTRCSPPAPSHRHRTDGARGATLGPVARFAQLVDGVPVYGAELVVSLDERRRPAVRRLRRPTGRRQRPTLTLHACSRRARAAARAREPRPR